MATTPAPTQAQLAQQAAARVEWGEPLPAAEAAALKAVWGTQYDAMVKARTPTGVVLTGIRNIRAGKPPTAAEVAALKTKYGANYDARTKQMATLLKAPITVKPPVVTPPGGVKTPPVVAPVKPPVVVGQPVPPAPTNPVIPPAQLGTYKPVIPVAAPVTPTPVATPATGLPAQPTPVMPTLDWTADQIYKWWSAKENQTISNNWASAMTPFMQLQQNAAQYANDSNEAKRRWDAEQLWNTNRDRYNMDLTTRQQNAAEGVSATAASQWNQQFVQTNANDAWSQGFNNRQLQQNADLARQAEESAKEQARYAAFGRAQAGSANWARSW